MLLLDKRRKFRLGTIITLVEILTQFVGTTGTEPDASVGPHAAARWLCLPVASLELIRVYLPANYTSFRFEGQWSTVYKGTLFRFRVSIRVQG